jgi:hypothetical protein
MRACCCLRCCVRCDNRRVVTVAQTRQQMPLAGGAQCGSRINSAIQLNDKRDPPNTCAKLAMCVHTSALQRLDKPDQK